MSWEDSHAIFYILTITAFHCNSTVVIEISWTANPEVYTTWPLHLPAPDLDKGFPGDTSGKEPARRGFNSWAGKISWRRAWQLTPVFLPEESPWTEEPGRLQSMGLQRVRHDWATKQSTTLPLRLLVMPLPFSPISLWEMQQTSPMKEFSLLSHQMITTWSSWD